MPNHLTFVWSLAQAVLLYFVKCLNFFKRHCETIKFSYNFDEMPFFLQK